VVTDKSRVVGIVTVSDLLALLGGGFERSASTAKRRILNHRVPHRKAHRTGVAW
jgi:CBS domain-containing protein